MNCKRIHIMLLILLLLTCTSCETPKTVATDAATSGNADLLLGTWARSDRNCDKPELSFTPSTAAIFVEAGGVPTTFDYSPISYAADGSTVTVQLYRPHPYAKDPQKDFLTFRLEGRDAIVMTSPGTTNRRFKRCVDTKNGK